MKTTTPTTLTNPTAAPDLLAALLNCLPTLEERAAQFGTESLPLKTARAAITAATAPPGPLDKAGELAALDAFRASLPADTYLTAWLDYARPSIAQDVTSDIFPTFRPAEARAAQLAALTEAQKQRDDAKAYALTIRAAAAEEAGNLVTAARHEAARTAARLNRDLEEATAAARRFIRAAAECERTAPEPSPATQNPNS